jgi:hypothetical protein
MVSMVSYLYFKCVSGRSRSKAYTVFARSDAGIVGSNPTQGMDVWYVYVFILCLCCSVFRERPCIRLITRPRSPTVCKMIKMKKKKKLDTVKV